MKVVAINSEKALEAKEVAEADLVIDARGVVIKEREGLGNRVATREEIEAAGVEPMMCARNTDCELFTRWVPPAEHCDACGGWLSRPQLWAKGSDSR